MTWQAIEQVREGYMSGIRGDMSSQSAMKRAGAALSVVEEALEAAAVVANSKGESGYHVHNESAIKAMEATLARAREGIKP